ncbi:hypothetical protein D3C71_2061020 [compost metagenome]
MFFPVLFGPIEVLIDLLDGFGGGEFIRRIALIQDSLRRQISVVLSVSNVSPGAACHEVVGVRLRHQLLEQTLKPIPLGF